MVGKVQTTFIKQSKRAVVNLDLELGLARFSNLELDLEFKTDFQSCTGLVLTSMCPTSHLLLDKDMIGHKIMAGQVDHENMKPDQN